MGNTGSFFRYDFDTPTVGADVLKKNKSKETGIEGVKSLFMPDEFGTPNPAVTFLISGVSFCTLTGVIIGGTSEATAAKERFVRMNQATAFENPHTARRLYYDRAMLGFYKGAFRWGWRMAAFSTTMIFLSSAIPAYRGKHSVFDYSAGTTLAGMAYKFNHGPKPMLAGGILGGLIGSVGGLVAFGALTLCGLSYEDLYEYRAQQARLNLENARAEKQRIDLLHKKPQ